jgi:hypothetical protein
MKKNKRILKDFILFTALPFFIPFIVQIPKSLIAPNIKWIIIIFVTGLDFYFAYKSLLEKEKDNNNEYIQRSIRYAFSGAHEIIERKRDVLSHETEFKRIDIKNNILPYDIHSQINDICKEFKKVMSSITQINNEFISITFVYHYAYDECSENDKQWKWIGGREPIGKIPLNDLIKKETTTFYQIINGNTHYIFGNSKKELADQGQYYLSKRDQMYNNVGSIFSIKLAFGNNAKTFVEGIVTVTTHGKYFTQYLDIDNSSQVLRNMIIDEIFPYYKKLIESEMGLMYIRHINKHNTQ